VVRSCGSGQCWLAHRHIPDHTSPSVKGDNIAVIKDTRRATPGANPVFRELFRNSHVSDKRKQEWQDAARYAGTGTPPLRFPVYEHLYQSNLCVQKMVELLEEMSNKFALDPEARLYHQFLNRYRYKLRMAIFLKSNELLLRAFCVRSSVSGRRQVHTKPCSRIRAVLPEAVL
jgi:hypothetical protein